MQKRLLPILVVGIIVLASLGGTALETKGETCGPGEGSQRLSGDAVIWYLGHCGFAVETRNHFLVFDYIEKTLEGIFEAPTTRSLEAGYIDPQEIRNKKVRVFVTHEHQDHYDPVIFEWENAIRDIQYFFGWRASNRPHYRYLTEARAEWVGDGLEIYTINSHHSGVPEVAYLVKGDGLVVYHNGDYRADYERDLPYLKSKADRIDIAFVSPVWNQGFLYYDITAKLIELFQPGAVFPMHIRVGDESQYFPQFRQAFEPRLEDGRVLITNNKKGARYVYDNGAVIEH